MNIRDPRSLQTAAADSLRRANCDPKRLILLHTTISLGVSVLTSLVGFLLNSGIAATGGLSGMQTRSILETIWQLADLCSSVFLPFWQMGLFFLILGLYRRESMEVRDLAEGFRRFGPVLRLLLLKGILFGLLALVCMYIASMVFMLTPMAQPLADQLTQMVESGALTSVDSLTSDSAVLETLMAHTKPVLYIFLFLYLLVAAPLFYRLRLAEFVLMDEPGTGALFALLKSRHITKGNRLQLLKLDIHFWWFFGAEGLLLLIWNLDSLMPQLGTAIGLTADGFFWVCYGLYAVGKLVLYGQAYAAVHTTYAAAYDVLQQPQPEPEVQPEQPHNFPWDE